jgi:plastocyanin
LLQGRSIAAQREGRRRGGTTVGSEEARVPQPTRRVATLVIALGVGLLSACSEGGDADAAATTSAHSEAEHSESTPSPSAGAADSSAPQSTAAPSTVPESSAAPSAAPAEPQSITATEGEMYVQRSEDSLSPCSYTIQVVNEGRATHDLVVERDGQDVAATDTIPPGGSATLTVTLEAGDYVFYCSVANHRAMGMETSVTVGA